MKRAALVVITIFGIAIAGASPASAATDLIGGTLSVYPDRVTLLSTATVPVHVAMTVEGPFSVAPETFDMEPGATVTMAVSGTPTGRVSAAMRSLSVQSGDAASVTLVAGMPQPAPFTIPVGPIGIVLLALGALALLMNRLRPWQYRLARKGN